MRKIRWPLLLLQAFAPAAGAEVAECTTPQLDLPAASAEEVREHRRSALPAVIYPFDTKRDTWSFTLTLKIDAQGQVVCYRAETEDGSPPDIDTPRREIIDGLGEWRYSPFIVDGKATPVTVREAIPGQETLQALVPMPVASQEKVHISLERSECNGSCPSYRVDLFGDGRAEYEGRAYVAVMGKHAYRVAPEKIRQLVDSARTKELWSMRTKYDSPISDGPTYEIGIDLGNGNVHTITDYQGESVGMPRAISGFEDEIDVAARSNAWSNLSNESVAALERKKFSFRSAAGADLLLRAFAMGQRSEDAAMARVVELGAPLAARKGQNDFGSYAGRSRSLLEKALHGAYPLTAAAIIKRGELQTRGRADQEKLDKAFRAAITGADLELVKVIWESGGEARRPSLEFVDSAGGDPPQSKTVPVILLVGRGSDSGGHDSIAVAEWLIAHGCDVSATSASGANLLHNAALSNDVLFTRFLLQKGLDPNNRNDDGILPIGSTYSEGVVMLLLAAGTDTSSMETDHYSFRKFAIGQGWYRVIAWLDAHPR